MMQSDYEERFTVNHFDARCQPSSGSTVMILWRRAPGLARSTDITAGACAYVRIHQIANPCVGSAPAAEGSHRRRRPGRIPIITAIITAAGAVAAAVVAGAFSFLG
jgi:hypothetical protein